MRRAAGRVSDGKVLGVNIARAGRVISYAIPADAILKVLPT